MSTTLRSLPGIRQTGEVTEIGEPTYLVPDVDRASAVRLENINPDSISTDEIFNSIVDLYMKGYSGKDEFSNTGWNETYERDAAIKRLCEEQLQYEGDNLILSLLKYKNLIVGFMTTVLFPMKKSVRIVAEDVVGYFGNASEEDISEFERELRNSLLDILTREKSFQNLTTTDDSSKALQQTIPIVKDIVVSTDHSKFSELAVLINMNMLDTIAKLGAYNPYALFLTNSKNPINDFMKTLGPPNFLLKKVALERDGKRIELCVYALCLTDIQNLVRNEKYASREMLQRALLNNPSAFLDQLRKQTFKKLKKLKRNLLNNPT
jgi:hypothetical protein